MLHVTPDADAFVLHITLVGRLWLPELECYLKSQLGQRNAGVMMGLLYGIIAGSLQKRLLSLSLMPTPTHKKHIVAPSSSRPFCQPLAVWLTITSVGFHGPALLCNLCTTWESVTERSKDKIVPIPPIAMWHSNTSNCSLLKAICSFLPRG